ncbi:Uncharacterised protein [Vibrio cholerae]|nr:Uncharacterised protein [Vibrio cholerae]
MAAAPLRVGRTKIRSPTWGGLRTSTRKPSTYTLPFTTGNTVCWPEGKVTTNSLPLYCMEYSPPLSWLTSSINTAISALELLLVTTRERAMTSKLTSVNRALPTLPRRSKPCDCKVFTS